MVRLALPNQRVGELKVILRTLLVVAFGAFAFGALANVPIDPPSDPGDPGGPCAEHTETAELFKCLIQNTPPSNDFGMPDWYTGGGRSAPAEKEPPSLCQTYQRFAESTGEGAGENLAGRGAAAAVAIMVTVTCLNDMAGDFGNFLSAGMAAP